MTRAEILNLIRTYFEEELPDVDLSHFETKPVSELLQESIDAVGFLMYLEEKLGLEDELNIEASMFANNTMGQLITEVEQYLSEHS